jgi:multidrug efflux system membrane fusion protein
MVAPVVTVTPALIRDVPVYLDEPVGKAVATESVTVQPQVTGLLVARHFVDGQNVHKGQLLFEIDPRPFQAALDQAKANLNQAKAALSYAQNDYQRYLNLKGSPAVSQEEIEQKENTVEVDQANVEANQAGLETAQVNLDYCKISSPIDGRTGARLVDVGNVVGTNGGPNGAASQLLTIQKLDPIYVDFTITENDLATVQRYMTGGTLRVEAQLPSDLVPNTAAARPTTAPTTQTTPGAQSQPGVQPIGRDAPPGVSAAEPIPPRVGQLIFLDNAVQDGTGTVKLRAQLPNADGHFWPGQFVNVRLVLTVQHDAVLIPQQAVQISQNGPFVYVVGADSKAQLRPITTGQRQGTMVVAETGVSADENVMTTGQLIVQPGGPVTVATGGPPGGPPGGAPPSPAADAPAGKAAQQKMDSTPVKSNAGSAQS